MSVKEKGRGSRWDEIVDDEMWYGLSIGGYCAPNNGMNGKQVACNT